MTSSSSSSSSSKSGNGDAQDDSLSQEGKKLNTGKSGDVTFGHGGLRNDDVVVVQDRVQSTSPWEEAGGVSDIDDNVGLFLLLKKWNENLNKLQLVNLEISKVANNISNSSLHNW